MKKKWFKNKPLIDAITKTNRFKFIIFFTIFVALYAAFAFPSKPRNLFMSIISCHNNLLFSILFLLIFFLSTLNTCLTFQENDSYILRLKTKKNLVKQTILLALQINGLLFLCYAIIYTLLVNINLMGCYDTKPFMEYGINTDIYAIFTLVKFYLYGIVLTIINTLCYFIMKENKTFLIDLTFIFGFIFYQPVITNSNFKILPWAYYKIIDYKSFPREVLYATIYFILLWILAYGLFFLITRKKRSTR